MESVEQLMEILPLLIPLLLIDFGFKIYALIDIIHPDRVVKGGNKIVWIVVSFVINFGWIFYFLFGREE